MSDACAGADRRPDPTELRLLAVRDRGPRCGVLARGEVADRERRGGDGARPDPLEPRAPCRVEVTFGETKRRVLLSLLASSQAL